MALDSQVENTILPTGSRNCNRWTT